MVHRLSARLLHVLPKGVQGTGFRRTLCGTGRSIYDVSIWYLSLKEQFSIRLADSGLNIVLIHRASSYPTKMFSQTVVLDLFFRYFLLASSKECQVCRSRCTFEVPAIRWLRWICRGFIDKKSVVLELRILVQNCAKSFSRVFRLKLLVKRFSRKQSGNLPLTNFRKTIFF